MSDPRSSDGDIQLTSVEQADAMLADGGRLVLTPALRVPGAGQAAPADPEDDEMLLRRIVQKMLEEELRGDFGTRITRAVRKLVRAEVRALLAARDRD
jgi:hypothetical protein